jgi:8-oxo-dGTP pyrophosphatase MutT (NUDIX family)
MTVAPARPASTVVLVRPSHQRFDVFLVRRHDKIAFMGGAHVFPGGRVEEADRIDNARALCDGVDQALARIPDVAPEDAVGYHAAAIRELFEEAGVLLARTANGEMVTLEGDRFRGYRRGLAAGEVALREVAERERLRLALDELVLFAHWVTPEIESKRFDTRFFMAAVPDGQDPVHDESETTESAWLDPEDAIEQCRRDEIALPPPTWTTLRTLARYSSVDEVLGWARRTRIVRVQPGFIKREDQTLLTLPGDPLHPPLAGFETPEETRFILENGRWRARR